jgi:hemoglobin
MAYRRDVGSALTGAAMPGGARPQYRGSSAGEKRGSETLLEWAQRCDQLVPELQFASAVSLRLDSSQSVGETPDGVRLELRVHGVAAGPMLTGTFPPLAAHMLVDVDGIGTLDVRAPVLLNDGAVLEIEAIVRYDFGPDGYRMAAAGELPDSIVAGGLRFLTANPRYLWLNRAVCLGVGELRSKEKRIDYDLFVISASAQPRDPSKPYTTDAAPQGQRQAPLYERLGGREGLSRISSDFFRGLESNPQLARQNPNIARVSAGSDPVQRQERFADLLDQLTGGPGQYRGRSMQQVHGPMHLTDADWTLGGEEFVRALNKNGVSKPDRDELLTLIEALKSELVLNTVKGHGQYPG